MARLATQVQGNRSGRMLLGPLPSGNDYEGITLLGGSNSTIGGAGGAGNIIAFNLGSGRDTA